MGLGWEQRRRLSRVGAVVDRIARLPDGAVGAGEGDRAAVGAYLDELGSQISGSLSEGGELAVEFERLLGPARTLPPQTRAAAIAGWLGDVLAADEQEAAEARTETLVPTQLSRKVSIGFKVRSPIVREAADEQSLPGG
jgi:hypothetical protein